MSHGVKPRLGDFDQIFEVLRCLPSELPSQQSVPVVKEGLGNFDVVWRYLDAINPKSRVDKFEDNLTLNNPEFDSQSVERSLFYKKPRAASFDELQPIYPHLVSCSKEKPQKEKKQYKREDRGYRSDGYDLLCSFRKRYSTKTTFGKDSLGEYSSYKYTKARYTNSLDRVRSLTTKLVEMFPNEDSVVLQSPPELRAGYKSDVSNKSVTTSNSLHVFVDSSNILIGFLNKVKQDHGVTFRRPRLDFHALLHLLSRGRPVTRKVLVASAPLLQPFEEAETLGFEISILQRVAKSMMTDKDSSSDQEQETGRKQKGTNFEQGVDELLHLKMMESLLDYTPSVMVLATGDANVAEHSSGFFRCVERALIRGWKVEVVSFKKSLNRLWLDKGFRKHWSGRFRTILLDDFTEELFDR